MFLTCFVNVDEGGTTAAKVLKKLAGATDRYSMKLAREMTGEEHLSGMSLDEVAFKEYPYEVEFYWYTEKKHIPTNDPDHWSCISIRNLDDFLDKTEIKE